MSLTTGQVAVAEFKRHRVKALVRVDKEHEAYLAIIAEGIPDPEVFALLLDCVPGVSADDWQPEPSPIAEMEPGSGDRLVDAVFVGSRERDPRPPRNRVTISGSQIARRKSSRDRRPPTTNEDLQRPALGAVVPLQRVKPVESSGVCPP